MLGLCEDLGKSMEVMGTAIAKVFMLELANGGVSLQSWSQRPSDCGHIKG